MFGTCLEKVRAATPLVHCITNYVTVNDVANALLACGGSPIMSDEPRDVEDITTICGGLCINIGTLNWAYMNKILARWHQAGLHTADAIRQGDKKPAAAQKGGPRQLDADEQAAIARMLQEV